MNSQLLDQSDEMPRGVISHERPRRTRFADRGHAISAVRGGICEVEQEAGYTRKPKIPPLLSALAPHTQDLGKLTLSHRDTRRSKNEMDSRIAQVIIKAPSRSPTAPWA